MVNILTVVTISEDTIQTFKGFDKFWRQVIDNNPNLAPQKQAWDQDAVDIAHTYGLDPRRTSNICFIFPSEAAEKELEDFETRQLLCSRDTIVTLQIRRGNSRTMTIATAHSKEGFRIFAYTLGPRDPIHKIFTEE